MGTAVTPNCSVIKLTCRISEDARMKCVNWCVFRLKWSDVDVALIDVGIQNLKKVIYKCDDIIIAVKMKTTKRLLHLVKGVGVWGGLIRWSWQKLDKFKSTFLNERKKADHSANVIAAKLSALSLKELNWELYNSSPSTLGPKLISHLHPICS